MGLAVLGVKDVKFHSNKRMFHVLCVNLMIWVCSLPGTLTHCWVVEVQQQDGLHLIIHTHLGDSISVIFYQSPISDRALLLCKCDPSIGSPPLSVEGSLLKPESRNFIWTNLTPSGFVSMVLESYTSAYLCPRAYHQAHKTAGHQTRSRILYKDPRKISDFDKNLTEIIRNLRKEKDWVLVPRKKTGTWLPTETENYIKWMNKHPEDKYREVKNPELTATYTRANELLAEFRRYDQQGRIQIHAICWTRLRRIPTPWLLIKYYKDTKEDVSYPTNILIPATNFTQCHTKLV